MIAVLSTLAAPLSAQTHAELFDPFRANDLTRADVIVLQAGLALEGYYDGLLDGHWGPNSQGSMERYARDRFDSAPLEWHMAMLALVLVDWITEDGWAYQYFEDLGLSFLVPVDAMSWDAPTGPFANLHHENSTLAYAIARSSQSEVLDFHNYTVGWHERAGAPFTVRSDHLLVTSSVKRDGSILYTRSDRIGGGWSTVILSAAEDDGKLLGTVASSITVGRADPIAPTRGGHLDSTIRTVIEILQTGESEPPPQGEPGVEGSSGSGFYVSTRGHVLTNAHVVDGCVSISADGIPARRLAVSEDLDLAVLTTAAQGPKAFARFSPGPARLNADVTVAGYPYAGVLGGFNVTRGTVSALRGIGGDPTQIQISAPVQSGNSGGPVIASDGEVVGVVVSKLDTAFLEKFGEIPQNVNFAVSGEVAKRFLAQNGVEPVLGRSDVALDPVTLAELAADFTVLIECR